MNKRYATEKNIIEYKKWMSLNAANKSEKELVRRYTPSNGLN